MNKGIASVCGLLLLLGLTTFARSQSSLPEPTLWDHNGSVVSLVARGASREFYYQEPRQEMIDAGARPGSLLFRGHTHEGKYFGTAFIFKSHCGRIPYQVSGPILDNYEQVVLTGQAPRVGPDCQIRGHVADVLEFRLRKAGSPEAMANGTALKLASLLPALVGTWMPTSESAPTQFNTYKIRLEKNHSVTMTGIESLCTYSNFEVTPLGQLKADTTCGETIHESTGKSTFEFITGGRKGNILIISDAFKRTVNTDDNNREEENDEHPWVQAYIKVGE